MVRHQVLRRLARSTAIVMGNNEGLQLAERFRTRTARLAALHKLRRWCVARVHLLSGPRAWRGTGAPVGRLVLRILARESRLTKRIMSACGTAAPRLASLDGIARWRRNHKYLGERRRLRVYADRRSRGFRMKVALRHMRLCCRSHALLQASVSAGKRWRRGRTIGAAWICMVAYTARAFALRLLVERWKRERCRRRFSTSLAKWRAEARLRGKRCSVAESLISTLAPPEAAAFKTWRELAASLATSERLRRERWALRARWWRRLRAALVSHAKHDAAVALASVRFVARWLRRWRKGVHSLDSLRQADASLLRRLGEDWVRAQLRLALRQALVRWVNSGTKPSGHAIALAPSTSNSVQDGVPVKRTFQVPMLSLSGSSSGVLHAHSLSPCDPSGHSRTAVLPESPSRQKHHVESCSSGLGAQSPTRPFEAESPLRLIASEPPMCSHHLLRASSRTRFSESLARSHHSDSPRSLHRSASSPRIRPPDSPSRLEQLAKLLTADFAPPSPQRFQTRRTPFSTEVSNRSEAEHRNTPTCLTHYVSTSESAMPLRESCSSDANSHTEPDEHNAASAAPSVLLPRSSRLRQASFTSNLTYGLEAEKHCDVATSPTLLDRMPRCCAAQRTSSASDSSWYAGAEHQDASASPSPLTRMSPSCAAHTASTPSNAPRHGGAEAYDAATSPTLLDRMPRCRAAQRTPFASNVSYHIRADRYDVATSPRHPASCAPNSRCPIRGREIEGDRSRPALDIWQSLAAGCAMASLADEHRHQRLMLGTLRSWRLYASIRAGTEAMALSGAQRWKWSAAALAVATWRRRSGTRRVFCRIEEMENTMFLERSSQKRPPRTPEPTLVSVVPSPTGSRDSTALARLQPRTVAIDVPLHDARRVRAASMLREWSRRAIETGRRRRFAAGAQLDLMAKVTRRAFGRLAAAAATYSLHRAACLWWGSHHATTALSSWRSLVQESSAHVATRRAWGLDLQHILASWRKRSDRRALLLALSWWRVAVAASVVTAGGVRGGDRRRGAPLPDRVQRQYVAAIFTAWDTWMAWRCVEAAWAAQLRRAHAYARVTRLWNTLGWWYSTTVLRSRGLFSV